MRRRIWVAGLVVVGAIGWYLFRPERLFVKDQGQRELADWDGRVAAERPVPLHRA